MALFPMVTGGGSGELYYVDKNGGAAFSLGDTISVVTSASVALINVQGKATSISFSGQNYPKVCRKSGNAYTLETLSSISGNMSDPSSVMAIILESNGTANYSFTIN